MGKQTEELHLTLLESEPSAWERLPLALRVLIVLVALAIIGLGAWGLSKLKVVQTPAAQVEQTNTSPTQPAAAPSSDQKAKASPSRMPSPPKRGQ